MIFHENRLLADDSHEISFLIFFRNLGKMSQNLSSAAVVIGALRVKLEDAETTIQFKHVYFNFYEGFIHSTIYMNILVYLIVCSFTKVL